MGLDLDFDGVEHQFYCLKAVGPSFACLLADHDNAKSERPKSIESKYFHA